MKFKKLIDKLKSYQSALLAFSGGVDSTFLLYAAKEALSDNILAVTATSETYPEHELKEAQKIAKSLNVKWIKIQTYELQNEKFAINPKDRCYHCKKELFTTLKNLAKEFRLEQVLDGSTKDDLKDFRPGAIAKKELGVISPLQEIGFNKDEIRALSKEFNLPTASKPSYACLASRIPYGTKITKEILNQIEAAEDYLKELGFKQLRVRHHGDLARIEIDYDSLPILLNNQELMGKINKRLEKLGYFYVTLDLKGYRTGSLNEVLKNE